MAEQLSSADVADRMRKFADALVSVMANDAQPLSWDIAGAAHIDLLADAILAETPSKADLNDAMLRISAFVGEFLVRNAGGTWHVDEVGGRERISVLLPNGERADPMRAAAARLLAGSTHSLAQYIQDTLIMSTGDPTHDPSDEQAAVTMRRLAELIAQTMVDVGGPELGWDQLAATKLDSLCELIMAGRSSVADETVAGLGAYLGELLVRNGGGRWTVFRDLKEYAVAMPSGLHGMPRNKAAKRLREGKHHDLFLFLHARSHR